MKVKVDSISVGLREYNTNDVVGKSRAILRYYVNSFIEAWRHEAPVKTGRLRDSCGNPSKEGILEFSPQGFGAVVGSAVWYTMIVNNGIQKSYRIITARSGMNTGAALRFKGADGQMHYAKEVVHPPVQGKFFIERAMMIAETKTNAYMGTLNK